MSAPRDPRREYAPALAALVRQRQEWLALDCGSGLFDGGFRNGLAAAVDSARLMVSLAAGAAAAGRTAVCHAPAADLAAAAYAVLGGMDTLAPVVLVGVVRGLCCADMAPMSALPDMAVVCPADGPEAVAALAALMDRREPAYLRLPGQPVPRVTAPGEPFAVGPLRPLRDGRNLCVLTAGALAAPALGAADRLLGQGIFAAVIHAPTVRPLDADAVRLAARRTGRVLVCEEHGPAGGLGDAVRRALQGQPAVVDAVCFPGAGEGGDSLRTASDAIFLRAMDLMEW